jgi:hypothetical protein
MTPDQSTPIIPLLGRVFWIMVGPLVLTLLTFTIIRIGSGWLTAADIAFFVVLGGMVLGRWLEFRGGSPQTSTGEPATAAHLRRYAVGTILVGLLIWVVANLIGNHLLER